MCVGERPRSRHLTEQRGGTRFCIISKSWDSLIGGNRSTPETLALLRRANKLGRFSFLECWDVQTERGEKSLSLEKIATRGLAEICRGMVGCIQIRDGTDVEWIQVATMRICWCPPPSRPTGWNELILFSTLVVLLYVLPALILTFPGRKL